MPTQAIAGLHLPQAARLIARTRIKPLRLGDGYMFHKLGKLYVAILVADIVGN